MTPPVDQRDVARNRESVNETPYPPFSHSVDYKITRNTWTSRHPQPAPRRAPAPWPFIGWCVVTLIALAGLVSIWPHVIHQIAEFSRWLHR